MKKTDLFKPLSREDAEAAVEALSQYGSMNKAAASLGIRRSTLQNRLRRATQLGLPGTGLIGPPAAVGRLVGRTNTLYDENGARLQWREEYPSEGIEDILSLLQDTFKAYRGFSKLPPAPKETDSDLLTLYALADPHLGMYAWWKEAGDSYDINIAEKLIRDTMAELVTLTPKASTAVILNLGDFFHADSDEKRTRKSGNILDVDTRYGKVLQIGFSLMHHLIDLALQKHDKVILRNNKGNHDPYAALALSVGFGDFYRNNPRVLVDPGVSPYWWMQFGNVMLASTHGDMAKPRDMPAIMASYQPKMWGSTEYRYALLGHVHHEEAREDAGVKYETFKTLAPKDNWGRSVGFISSRGMSAVTYHKQTGEKYRTTLNIKGPQL